MDKKLLMMALLMTTGLATQAQERLTQYQVRNAITVRTPIMNDSINPKGEKHTAKALLQTPVMLDLANAPTQMLSADTAGLVTFAKTDKDNLLYLLFLGLGASALCFVLWNYTVEQLGAVMAGLYIYLVPVTTLFASFLILGERISLVKLLGVTLTLFGLFVSEGKSSLPIRARLKKTKLKNQDE